ncbi:MAG TPA: hypothetical protein VGO09_08835 [Flavisolibacter sp.]|nr:hypothetical protein [Flavisolibacter sp.]
MQNNNQNQGNDSEKINQDKSQQEGENSDKQNSSFDNPQEGSKWDNYQTRSLSADPEDQNNKITQEEVEQAIRSSEQDKSGK